MILGAKGLSGRMDFRCFGFVIPIAVYLCFTLPDLQTPAPYTDELFFAPSAMEMAGYDLPQEYKADIGVYELTLGGKPFPVMSLQYIGMLRAYFQGFVFFLAGPSLVALRGFHVFLGVLGILGTYFFARMFFRDSFAGMLAAFFLAFDPTYVFSTRMDSVGFSLSMVLRTFSLLLFLFWWRKGSRGALCLAFFLTGLAFSDKAIALWFYAALVLASLFIYPRQLLHAFSRLSWKGILLLLILAAAGGFIFLAWYGPRFGHFFGTWLVGSFSAPSDAHQAAGFLSRFWESFREFSRLIAITFSGNLRPDIVEIPEIGGQVFRCVVSLLLPISVSMIVFLPLVLIVPSFRNTGRKALFLMIAGGLVFSQILLLPLLESPFDLALDFHHLLVAYPLLQLGAAAVMSFLFRVVFWGTRNPEETSPRKIPREGANLAQGAARAPGVPGLRRWRRLSRVGTVCLLAAALLVIPLGMNAFNLMRVHRALQTAGGKGLWSDSIYSLLSFLEARGDVPVLCNDWGLNRPLLFLSQGKIRTLSPFHHYIGKPCNGSENPDYWTYLESLLEYPELLVVEHTKPWTAFDCPNEALQTVLRQKERNMTPLAEFSSRDGSPVYRVGLLKRKQ